MAPRNLAAASPKAKAGALCRGCGGAVDAHAGACPSCGGRRILRHPELFSLSVAHVDCDAFYASVEKRDNPALADRPVIVGGGRRGVVATACYIARTYGVHSAMPMFKALKACPDAVVIRPDMAKYAEAARRIRALMESLTPLVQPVSIDEAFLDLTGVERLHKAPAAVSLARLQARISSEVGVTASVGLSCNKFLAKIASDLDKPRGFSVIGRAEAQTFLADKPIGLIWGVGAALSRKLAADGLRTIGQLQTADPGELARRYGEIGLRLSRLARGEDDRPVNPERDAKSISAETTFETDISERGALEDSLWPLCEKVSRRIKEQGLAGRVAVLKLKRADFSTLTRRTTLDHPTQLAGTLFDTGRALLAKAHDGAPCRLIGIGLCDLEDAAVAGQPELFAPDDARLAAREAALDALRAKFGARVIGTGRGLKKPEQG